MEDTKKTRRSLLGGIFRSEEGPVYKTPSNNDERFVNTHVETTSHLLRKTQSKKQTKRGGK